ncbi:ABC transporter substrate-binding protein [Methanospirillum lacunae]|uniref:ABC transporter substrate-binding protein n=1 Tax=Methanospirillum lacunae TaxID=668570 RepID=A0A2V2N0V3_9EURY|nr:ABC transporter substrate-binding protein [Methanospirillum lacunae]PWR71276.1 ABC transporter substrate-binding protein [Methanospirillum lacunae]
MQKKFLLVFLILAICTVLCTIAYAESGAKEKTVTDMEGRTVSIPVPLQHVITVGSVPVQNSFLFALGEGNTISNDLPESFKKQGRWKYQYVFAPNLQGEPSIQTTNNQPNVEEIVKLNPDVVFTMDKPTVDLLEKSNIPVVYLSWVNDDDVKKLMTLLGEAYNKQDEASKYLKYFDDTVNKVSSVAATIPDSDRKKVLYLAYSSMSVPHKIGDWWIEKGGGISVSNATRETESLKIDAEQINTWNPDIIIVSTPDEIDAIQKDPKLADVTAIKNKAVYIAPMGAHTWANRGIETPLTVMWAAKTMYPDKFKDFDLEKVTHDFYKEFFGVDCTPDQIKDILSGKAKI